MKKALVVLIFIAITLAGWFIYLSYEANTRDEQAAEVPLITVMEILHASDLQQGVKLAVEQNNEPAINEWVEQALQVAQAANLSAQDIRYLQSKAAKEYLIFNAKRQLYNDAFEARYYALEEVESLKAQYPEAKDLFARTDALIKKRDAIIEQIAVALSGSETPDSAALEAARQQWLSQAQRSQTE